MIKQSTAPDVLKRNKYHKSHFLSFCDNKYERNKKNILKGKICVPDLFFPSLVKGLLKYILDINPILRYILK